MAEATAQIIASGTVVQVDLAQLSTIIAGVVTTVMRQVMVVGDPNVGAAQAAVQSVPATGAEFSLMVKIAPGNPELSQLCDLMRILIQQEQNIAEQLGAMPVVADSSFVPIP